MITVYVSIGNSDDKLSQHEWSVMLKRTDDAIRDAAQAVHGYWLSDTASRWQNACWCFELDPELETLNARLRSTLGWIAHVHQQDSISWAEVGQQEFIEPKPGRPGAGSSLLP